MKRLPTAAKSFGQSVQKSSKTFASVCVQRANFINESNTINVRYRTDALAKMTTSAGGGTSKTDHRLSARPDLGADDGHRWDTHPKTQVCRRRAPGGRWIRTFGSPTDPLPFSR